MMTFVRKIGATFGAIAFAFWVGCYPVMAQVLDARNNADLITVTDSGGNYDGTNVESVLAEIAADIAAVSAGGVTYYASAPPVASGSGGAGSSSDVARGDHFHPPQGASATALTDSGAYYTTDDVESALQQLGATVSILDSIDQYRIIGRVTASAGAPEVLTLTQTWEAIRDQLELAVPNSDLAAMASYTIKGNATGSSAVPTDLSRAVLSETIGEDHPDVLTDPSNDTANDHLYYLGADTLWRKLVSNDLTFTPSEGGANQLNSLTVDIGTNTVALTNIVQGAEWRFLGVPDADGNFGTDGGASGDYEPIKLVFGSGMSVAQSGSSGSYVWTLSSTGGGGGDTIYSADAALAGDRVISGGGFDLTLGSGASKLQTLSSATTDLISLTVNRNDSSTAQGTFSTTNNGSGGATAYYTSTSTSGSSTGFHQATAATGVATMNTDALVTGASATTNAEVEVRASNAGTADAVLDYLAEATNATSTTADATATFAANAQRGAATSTISSTISSAAAATNGAVNVTSTNNGTGTATVTVGAITGTDGGAGTDGADATVAIVAQTADANADADVNVSAQDEITLTAATVKLANAVPAIGSPASTDDILVRAADGVISYRDASTLTGGGSADQLGDDADRGDITISGTGTVATIDSGAVTLAKMADLADQRLIGNVSGGAAAPAALTQAEVQTMLHVDDLGTLSGVSLGSANLGTFTGDIVTTDTTIKSALQELETAITTLTPADLGLAGDGSTNDTSNLQTILTVGGRIYLPAGTYRIIWSDASGLDMTADNTHIIGAGIGKTKILLEPDSQPSVSTTYGIYVTGDNCSISGVTIEAGTNTGISPSVKHWRMLNIGNTTTNNGADGFTMQNVDVIGPEDSSAGTTFSGSPVRGQQGPCVPFYVFNSNDLLVSNCKFHGSTGRGANTEGSFGAELLSCERVRMSGCHFYNNYWDGLKINSSGAGFTTDANGASRDMVFSDCFMYDNGTAITYNVLATISGGGTNNDSGNANGMDCDGDNIVFDSCYAFRNYGSGLQAKNNSGDHLGRVSFVNCVCYDQKYVISDSAQVGQHGFHVEAGDGVSWIRDAANANPTNHCKFVGCIASENDGDGFSASYTIGSQWISCQSLDNGGDGFSMQDTTAFCIIQGCNAEGNGTAGGGAEYGIFISGGAGHRIMNNFVTGLPTMKAGSVATWTALTGQTPLTGRGIQISNNASSQGPVKPHFISGNIVDYVTDDTFKIHNSTTTALRVWNNYDIDGALITQSGTAPL